MVDVEVEFDYEAELEDELTIRVGDLIQDVKQMDGGWWEGSLKGRRGVFPDNFVKVLSKESNRKAKSRSNTSDKEENEAPADAAVVTLRKQSPGNNGGASLGVLASSSASSALAKKQCRVLFSYTPGHEDELELKLDEVIEVQGEVEDGWWRGTVNGKSGVFPSNFVEILNPRLPLVSENKSVVENKNMKNENHKDAAIRAPSKISSLIQEVEAKAKTTDVVAGSRKRNNSSTENLNPSSSAAANSVLSQPRRQSPLGRESAKKADHQRASSGSVDPPGNNAPTATTTDASLANAPKLPPKPVKEQCVVLFPYVALNDDELSLAEGQIVSIITREVEDKGWWKGEVDGKMGVFPDNFVKMISTSTSTTNVATAITNSNAPQPKSSSSEELSLSSKKPLRPPNSPAAAAVLHESSKGKSLSHKEGLSGIRRSSLLTEDSQPPSSSKTVGSKDALNNGVTEPHRSHAKGVSAAAAPPAVSSSSNVSKKQSGREGSVSTDRGGFPLSGSSFIPGGFKRGSLTRVTPPPKPKPPSTFSKPPSAAGSKPLTSSSTSALLPPPPSQRQPSIADRFTKSNSSSAVVSPSVKADSDFDCVEIKSDKLAHPTAARAKAPKRRPPSSLFAKDAKYRDGDESIELEGDKAAIPDAFHKSVEDVAKSDSKAKSSSDLFSKSLGEKESFASIPDRESNKSRLSFKLVRQVKDVFGGLTNGSTAKSDSKISNGDAASKGHSLKLKPESSDVNVAASKKLPPPKPPLPSALTREGSKNELIVPKTAEEPKKPDWLEELSRKQAVRKSGLFKDHDCKSRGEHALPPPQQQQPPQPQLPSPTAATATTVAAPSNNEQKPQVPMKPSQIREEARRSVVNSSRPSSFDSNGGNSEADASPPPVTADTPDPVIGPTAIISKPDQKATMMDKEESAAPSEEVKPEASEIDLGSLLERVRRLEKHLDEVKQEHEVKLNILKTEFELEKNARLDLEKELELLRRLHK